MNLEACYLGIPVISTRSLLLFHDRFLLEQKLMRHAKSVEEVMKFLDEILCSLSPKSKRDDLFAPNGADFSTILPHIKSLIKHS